MILDQCSQILLEPKRILILYWHPSFGKMRLAIEHHLKVLEYSDASHQILYYNVLCGAPYWLRYLNFDVIILHTTFLCLRHSPLFKFWKKQLQWIKDLDCLKIAIPQDEYDYSEILDQWLFDWNIDIIFSIFASDQQQIIYPKMYQKASFYQCLTGYIDDDYAQTYSVNIKSIEKRQYDIIYRAKKLPYKFGFQGYLKHKIAQIFLEKAHKLNLECNISTLDQDTIIGDQWFDFLGSGKTIIGCESGSSVLDKKGEIEIEINKLLSKNQQITFPEISNKLPSGWNDYQFFAISPRHFEAIMMKTCQILVEGNYNGILQPDQHYIPIKKDFSNLDEVIEKINDYPYLQKIADQAYQDIYLSGKYNYRQFTKLIEQAIINHQKPATKSIKFTLFNQLIITKIIKLSELIRQVFYLLVINLIIKKLVNWLSGNEADKLG